MQFRFVWKTRGTNIHITYFSLDNSWIPINFLSPFSQCLSLSLTLFLSHSLLLFSSYHSRAILCIVWGSILPTVYAFTHADPKSAKKFSQAVSHFLRFQDLRAYKLRVKCWWNWHWIFNLPLWLSLAIPMSPNFVKPHGHSSLPSWEERKKFRQRTLCDRQIQEIERGERESKKLCWIKDGLQLASLFLWRSIYLPTFKATKLTPTRPLSLSLSVSCFFSFFLSLALMFFLSLSLDMWVHPSRTKWVRWKCPKQSLKTDFMAPIFKTQTYLARLRGALDFDTSYVKRERERE